MNSVLPSRTIAITHAPSPKMEQGQRTHIGRMAVNFDRACRQHESYCQILRDCGAEVRVLEVNRELPDSVFVEDMALVLDEVAVLASMGVDSRRLETAGIERELQKYRELERISLPATIEGGDVLRVGRKLLVGVSSRTNQLGVDALAAVVHHYGYEVIPVHVRGCLHLKTACTALPDGSLLMNPAWLDVTALRGFECMTVPESEPWAGNVALVGATVCLAAEHLRARAMIRQRGFDVRTAELSEFAKAEGGVTCLSLLFCPRETARTCNAAEPPAVCSED